MIQKVKQFVLSQQYAPGFIGLWLNPFTMLVVD